MVADAAEIRQWAAERDLPVHLVLGGDRRRCRRSPIRPQHRRGADRARGAGATGLRAASTRTARILGSRQDDVWVVSGRGAARAVNLDDLTVLEAADFVAERLRRIGVNDALRAAGAVAGDDVRIGDLGLHVRTR